MAHLPEYANLCKLAVDSESVTRVDKLTMRAWGWGESKWTLKSRGHGFWLQAEETGTTFPTRS